MTELAVVSALIGYLALALEHEFTVVLHLQQHKHLLQQHDVQVDLLGAVRAESPGEGSLVHQLVLL